MGDADGTRNLSERAPLARELERLTLKGPALLDVLDLPELLLEGANLALRGRLQLRFLQELRRPASPVIVRTHMTRAAQSDEVLERVVAGEPKRIQVMDVERAPVLFGRLATLLAYSIAFTNLCLDERPSRAVIERLSAAPTAISRTAKVQTIERRSRARSGAVLPAGEISRWNQHCSLAAGTDEERLCSGQRRSSPQLETTVVAPTEMFGKGGRAVQTLHGVMLVRRCDIFDQTPRAPARS